MGITGLMSVSHGWGSVAADSVITTHKLYSLSHILMFWSMSIDQNGAAVS